MTVLVTLRSDPLGRVFAAPRYAAAAVESQIGLRTGERMTVADLVRAAMLPSANDAADDLAVNTGRGKAAFVARMNRLARRLGLRHTHYTTPVGLDTPGNYSSAADLARLALDLRRFPFARRTMNEPRALLRSGAHRRLVINRNTLVREVPWVNGVKTGHTLDAGYVLVASGTRHGLTFVSVVLGTPSEAARDADSLALLKWGFATFRIARPVRRGEVLARARERYAGDRKVPLLAGRSVRRLVRRANHISVHVTAPREVTGPLRRGAVVGHVAVRAGGRVLARVSLLTGRAVAAVPFTTRALYAIGGPGTLVGTFTAAAVALIVVRRRATLRRRNRPGAGAKVA
jgi:serine-type D-Ala-D-Ala carboxypeptidase (penicillin-binding protein 5/6)